MSKSKTTGLAYKDATPQQLAAAKTIIADAESHRYYVNRIYGMYNAISGKNEPPQTCASCLRTRAREIKKWYDEGVKASKPAKAPRKDESTPVGTEVPTEEVKPAEVTASVEPVKELNASVAAIKMAEGEDILFDLGVGGLLENGAKGVATTLDGKKVKAGTYKTAEGHDVKVQIGGKATYAENYDDLAS